MTSHSYYHHPHQGQSHRSGSRQAGTVAEALSGSSTVPPRPQTYVPPNQQVQMLAQLRGHGSSSTGLNANACSYGQANLYSGGGTTSLAGAGQGFAAGSSDYGFGQGGGGAHSRSRSITGTRGGGGGGGGGGGASDGNGGVKGEGTRSRQQQQQHERQRRLRQGSGTTRRASAFERQRAELIGEIAQSLDHAVQNLNQLNRSIESITAVGEEFAAVEALWSRFEGYMGPDTGVSKPGPGPEPGLGNNSQGGGVGRTEVTG